MCPILESYTRVEPAHPYVAWSVGDLLRDVAARFPDRTALIVPSIADDSVRQWTYAELLAEAERAARALLGHFNPGDHVATWAVGRPEILFLQLGAALAGIVLATINPASRAGELAYLLEHSEARGLFLDRSFRGADNVAVLESIRSQLSKLERIELMDSWDRYVANAPPSTSLPTVAADAPAMILFTSGTTGKPKGAIEHHSGILNCARRGAELLELGDGAVWLNVLPMFHIGGSATISLGCMWGGGTQVMFQQFEADAMVRTIERFAVQITMAVPTMLHAMFRSPLFEKADFSALKLIVMGGTPIAPELVREVEQRARCEVMVLFGQTEAGGTMAMSRRGDSAERVTNSVGAPLPGSEAKIVVDGTIVPRGEIGEICIRTECAMREYFKMPEQTAITIDREGWLHTGDLGVMREDGYLQITGRLKDMIIRGGENIYPREIEDLLVGHPSVAQVAVYGIADAKWGELVAAAVILRPSATVSTEELVAFLEARIAHHKVPRAWRFVTELPVNASGKIQKFVLRAHHEERS